MIFCASAVALALGVFVVVSPARAVRIWGWEHFDALPRRHKATYLLSFRVMGIVICLAGMLVAGQPLSFLGQDLQYHFQAYDKGTSCQEGSVDNSPRAFTISTASHQSAFGLGPAGVAPRSSLLQARLTTVF